MKLIAKYFWTMNSTVKWMFILCFTLMLLYKTIFGLHYEIQVAFKSTVDFIEKIFYAIIGSTIFYFINQHLPKERKRAKILRLVDFKIVILERHVQEFLYSLDVQNNMAEALDNKEIEKALKMRGLKLGDRPLTATGKFFNNHLDLFSHWYLRIGKNVREILVYSDYYNDEMLKCLVDLSIQMEYFHSDLGPFHKHVSLFFVTSNVRVIQNSSFFLTKIFKEKYNWYLESPR